MGAYEDLTATAIAHLPCDDNAASTTVVALKGSNGVMQDSVNTEDASVAGPLPGMLGLSFDGSPEGAKATFSGASDYPVSFGGWFNRTGGGDSVGVFLGMDNHIGQYLALATNRNVEGKPAIVARNPNFKYDVSSAGASGWFHLFGVYESATDRRLYLDGELVATGTESVSWPGANTFAIAYSADSSPGGYLQGEVSDAIAFDKVVTPSEISTLIAGPQTTPTTYGRIATPIATPLATTLG